MKRYEITYYYNDETIVCQIVSHSFEGAVNQFTNTRYFDEIIRIELTNINL